MRSKNRFPSILLLASVLVMPICLRAEGPAKSAFDEAPMPVKSVSPTYPEDMKRIGAAGIVTMTISIDENGDVVERVVTKSTRPEFEAAAVNAVAKWKFKPARKAGVAVKSRISIPIKFTCES